MLKQAFRKDEALVADIATRNEKGDDFGLWWLGQSGFLVKYRGKAFLLDPYLSDSLTKKYAETDLPHVRITERVIAPEQLNRLSFVTSSHNHTDHLDAETLLPLLQENKDLTLVLPEANMDFAKERLQNAPFTYRGLNDGKSLVIDGFTITGIAAAHNTIETDEKGRCKFMGFIIDLGDWTLYHSGDTLWHPGLVETLMFHRPQLVILPINGNKPERRVAGNLNGAEAAALAKACGARCVIPCHYDMFAFNTETPELFTNTCEHLNQPYRVLQQGEHWSSADLD